MSIKFILETVFWNLFFFKLKLSKQKRYLLALNYSKSQSCRERPERDHTGRGAGGGAPAPREAGQMSFRGHCSLSPWPSRNQHQGGQRVGTGQQSFEKMLSPVREKGRVLRSRRGPAAFLKEQTHSWVNFYKGTGWWLSPSVWSASAGKKQGYHNKRFKTLCNCLHNRLLSLICLWRAQSRNFTLTLISPGGGFS